MTIDERAKAIVAEATMCYEPAELEALVRRHMIEVANAVRESGARIAMSFTHDYGAQVGDMALRIAEVIRRNSH